MLKLDATGNDPGRDRQFGLHLKSFVDGYPDARGTKNFQQPDLKLKIRTTWVTERKASATILARDHVRGGQFGRIRYSKLDPGHSVHFLGQGLGQRNRQPVKKMVFLEFTRGPEPGFVIRGPRSKRAGEPCRPVNIAA